MFGRREPSFNVYSVLTFIIGALAGAAVALLYAPTTGRKLQRQIKEALKDALEDQVENVQDAVKKFTR
jgi:gas vesicle protein